MRTARRKLVRLLQSAYSGELGAAFAYQGHARSVTRAHERDGIRRIEREEWAHRASVGRMLDELGAQPARWREFAFGAIGRTLRALCPVSGWRLPMFCAWRLEVMNVAEYSAAAAHAAAAGFAAMARELRAMADVEAEHVEFFHALLRAAPAPSEPSNATPGVS